MFQGGWWWSTPLVPALRIQRQVDLGVQGQSGPQHQFQDSHVLWDNGLVPCHLYCFNKTLIGQ